MNGTTARDPGCEPGVLRVAVPLPDQRPSYYALRDFCAELAEQGAIPQSVRWEATIGRALAKTRNGYLSRLGRRKGPLVVPLMGPRLGLLHAAGLSGSVVPYCWDVWEPEWESWAEALRPFRPAAVFVTARHSTEFLAHALPDSRVIHLPEATRLSRYCFDRPLAARNTGVLELGRRYEKWHEAVSEVLKQRSDRRHLYETRSGQVVFPDEQSMQRGLADSMISVCFPSSRTHPQRSGCVETMTQRYLESIASGCLIIGHAPAELVDLLGFNPVVEVDWSAPGEQLLDILTAPERWQPWVEQSRQRAVQVGDWSVRVRALRAELAAMGLLGEARDALFDAHTTA